MEEAAMATPGQTAMATSTAASGNPFAVSRMLGSLFYRLWQDLVSIVTGEYAPTPIVEWVDSTPTPPSVQLLALRR
jgi:hypothetical protein